MIEYLIKTRSRLKIFIFQIEVAHYALSYVPNLGKAFNFVYFFKWHYVNIGNLYKLDLLL